MRDLQRICGSMSAVSQSGFIIWSGVEKTLLLQQETGVAVMGSYPEEAQWRSLVLYSNSSTVSKIDQARKLCMFLPKSGTSWEKGELLIVESLNIAVIGQIFITMDPLASSWMV